jgi:chondroitin 4-sulfotransferase 11
MKNFQMKTPINFLSERLLPSFFNKSVLDRNPYKSFNHQYKVIFIHIPKNGGISVEKALFKQKVGHTRLQLFQQYDPDKFHEYYKFAFVRNPWDRLVSAYFFLKAGGRNPVDAQFSKEFLSGLNSFEDFVLSLENKKNRKTALHWLHFRPQLDFIVDKKGVISLDYIGRFEILEKDFDVLSKRIGIAASLSHENRSPRKKQYYEYYSKTMVEIVSEIYKKDIMTLSYSFGSDDN